jgi:hypothetical protein
MYRFAYKTIQKFSGVIPLDAPRARKGREGRRDEVLPPKPQERGTKLIFDRV